MKKLLSFLLAVSLFAINFSIIERHQVSAVSTTEDIKLLKENKKALCDRVLALKKDIENCQNRQNIFAIFSRKLKENIKDHLIPTEVFPLIEKNSYLTNTLMKDFGLKDICDTAKDSGKRWFEKGALELRQDYDNLLSYVRDLHFNSTKCTKDLDKEKTLMDFMNYNNCKNNGKPVKCYSVINFSRLDKTLLKLIAEQELKN